MDIEIISEYIADGPNPYKLYSGIGCSMSLNPPSKARMIIGIGVTSAYKTDIISIDKVEKQARSIPDTIAI